METIDLLGVPHTYELTAPTDSPLVLVFVHGWLLSRHYWLPLVQQLCDRYQCLTYDLRGFGDSDQVLPCGEERYTPAAYAQDLELLLQRLDISSVWLVGHSLGGTIALWTADRLREKVRGVVCLNAGGGIYLHEEFERFRTAGQQILKFRPAWLEIVPLLEQFFCRSNVYQPLALEWGKQRIKDFICAHSEAALGTLLASTTAAEVHLLPQLVARLPQPVYFMAGRNDRIMEPKYVRHLASFHPLFDTEESNVIELEDCGHLSMLEQPDRVASHLCEILQHHCSTLQG
uniref:Alpha/beta hydrolase fold protein n=1 Tax=Cyanothece sp. (strain PCC 7425 / ATCC 29141) TaxID=395961 RepID=B8HWL0_CYAP4